MSIFGDTGTDELQQALEALGAVQAPTAAALSLPQLENYVRAGVLTPEQYQAMLTDPDTYSKIIQATQDSTGSNAQKAALEQLGGIVKNGGSTPINDANLKNNIDQTNQAMQSARGAITQDAQSRGVGGGGLEFVNKLLNEQGNSSTANSNAVNSAATNAQLALQALSQEGTVGGQLQSQSNQSSQAQADAATQIAEYNNNLKNAASQYNIQNNNQAQQMNLANSQDITNRNTANDNARIQYNASVPQQVFQNQFQKATGQAGVLNSLGQLQAQDTRDNAAFTGNLIGTGATVLGSIYGGPVAGAAAGAAAKKGVETLAHGGEVGGKCYAQGGEFHEHALCLMAGGGVPGDDQVPGDSIQNDTVDAKLSPNEIVLPRSVAQAPNAPQAASQFVQQIKGAPQGQPQGPASFADVIKLLESQGLELTLSSQGA